ncbi:MAG: hypothetical protein RLZZ71_2122 [Bacteroidota bacterium]|jgi:hypothetical protein
MEGINQDFLLTLNRSELNGLFTIENLPILEYKFIKEKIDSLEKFENEATGYFEYIENNLIDLLGEFSYCESLSASYTNLESIEFNFYRDNFLELNSRILGNGPKINDDCEKIIKRLLECINNEKEDRSKEEFAKYLYEKLNLFYIFNPDGIYTNINHYKKQICEISAEYLSKYSIDEVHNLLIKDQELIQIIRDIIVIFKSDVNKGINEKIKKLVIEYNSKLRKRHSAFNIANAYEKCKLNSEIKAFSHRRIGWSNPLYPLNKDFSFEVKTNFGYGSKSYFYVILKYKGLAIIPFSEWIMYKGEDFDFSEIVRYSKKYNLVDESWLSALIYVKDACNLSIQNESQFIKEYIIDQCEKMVDGLDNIMKESKFKYHSETIKANNESFSYEPLGHSLIEFRGEKISGALNFIEKIRQFNGVGLSGSYVTRIELLNKRILPILEEEILLIPEEIRTNELLNKTNIQNKSLLNPDYDKFIKIKYDFVNKDISKIELKNRQKHIQDNEEIFKIEYPAEHNFIEDYKKLVEHINETHRKLFSLKSTLNQISSYKNAIDDYFSKLIK